MILTLFGYVPPARYDLIPWNAARIEQAATETGSYTEVETILLDPIDSDPTAPAVRGFTTELASAGDWYRIVWVDYYDDESAPTAPVQVFDPAEPFATRAELATLLKVDATANAAALDRVLEAAAGEIISEIGTDQVGGGWRLALATEVNLERASEHWAQLKSPFGFVGFGGAETGAPAVAARDSWDRHAYKLAPLKETWGIA